MCFHIRGVSIARDVPSLIYQFSRYQELTVVDSFMAKKKEDILHLHSLCIHKSEITVHVQ